MTMVLIPNRNAKMSAVVRVSTTRGVWTIGANTGISRQSLPTDPIGNFVLTLSNLILGSAIRIETQTGVEIEFRTADSVTEVFNLQAYSPGSANNNLRIKVRKGSSSPFYQPYETQATAAVGSQSIFVSQILDE